MWNNLLSSIVLFFLIFGVRQCKGRIHKITIEGDTRSEFSLSSFGYLKNGQLTVNISGFTIKEAADGNIGFTLDRSKSSGMAEYLESHSDRCIFDERNLTFTRDVTLVMFRIFLKNSSVVVRRTGNGQNKPQIFYLDPTASDNSKAKSTESSRKRREAASAVEKAINQTKATLGNIPTAVNKLKNSAIKKAKDVGKAALAAASQAGGGQPQATRAPPAGHDVCDIRKSNKLKPLLGGILKLDKTPTEEPTFGLVFSMNITNKSETGLYSLYFHNCFNSGGSSKMAVDFNIEICERNGDNYLSAGQIPLPTVYFLLCVVFFLLGLVWLVALCRANKQDVYKLHYIMLTVIWVKALSLMFHAMNFHFISKEGMHEEAWAVLYYIVHLLKGALLFSTIVLIGAGWMFLRHVLSARVKKLFLVIIPLQIISNTASIILEEKDASSTNFTAWSQVFILVDLLCCGAILFPVVWSIRHLQEGAQVDGKEAMNLCKLKLFRHFYIMVVCYIYFTRIIVYLLKVTVPFQFMWLNELFKEVGTMAFFIMTGVKFQPADNNPYLQVPQDSDEEEEMEEVVTTTGETETLRRVNRGKNEDENTETRQETSLEFD